MTPERGIAAIVSELEAELQRLREMLAGRDEATLSERPLSDKWSVMENLQHLVLTGLAHFAHFVPDHRDWGAFGLVPVEPKAAKQLRLANGGSVEDLLQAWRAGHEVIVPRILQRDTPEVRRHVSSHTRHQVQHIDQIRRLLKRMDRSPGSGQDR